MLDKDWVLSWLVKKAYALNDGAISSVLSGLHDDDVKVWAHPWQTLFYSANSLIFASNPMRLSELKKRVSYVCLQMAAGNLTHPAATPYREDRYACIFEVLDELVRAYPAQCAELFSARLAPILYEHDIAYQPNTPSVLSDYTIALNDSRLFRKRSVVLCLDEIGCAFQIDVPGLSRELVMRILAERDSQPQAPAGQESPSTGEALTAPPMAQGGSMPETDKIKATNTACIQVEASIVEQRLHLDRKGKIGKDEFAGLVETSMSAAGVGKLYQVTAAKSFFKSSDKLAPFKWRRGEKQ